MLAVITPTMFCTIAVFSCLMLTGAISLSRWVMARFSHRKTEHDRIWNEVVKGAVPMQSGNLSQICIDVSGGIERYPSTYSPFHTYQQSARHPFDIDISVDL